MTWDALKYGMAVAAGGAAVTGTLIWFGSRDTLELIDEIELWQAATERAMATQYSTNGSNVATEPYVQMYVSGSDASGLFWVSDMTNGTAQTNLYAAATWTNEWATFTNLPGEFFSPIPYFYRVFRDYSVTQRYIWGAWSAITLAGHSGGLGVAYTGAYHWASRAWSPVESWQANFNMPVGYQSGQSDAYHRFTRTMVDVYTNSAGRTMYDVGPVDESPAAHPLGVSSYFVSGVGSVMSGRTPIPGVRADFTTWTNSAGGAGLAAYGQWRSVSTSVAGLQSNRLRDAWTYRADVQRNPFIGMPWRKTQNTIADSLRASTVYYVNDSLTNAAGSFDGYTNIPTYIATNAFDIIGAGVTNLFPDEQEPSWIVRTNDWALRYKYARVLQRTHATAAECSWTWIATNGPSEKYWEYTSDSYTDLLNDIETNKTPNVYTEGSNAVTPRATVEMSKSASSPIYQAVIWIGRGVLISHGLSTNIPIIGADFYAAGSPEATFDAYGATVTNGTILRFDAQDWSASSNITGVATSGYFGVIEGPDIGAMPDEPGIGTNTSRGWIAGELDIVLRWGFHYASEDIP